MSDAPQTFSHLMGEISAIVRDLPIEAQSGAAAILNQAIDRYNQTYGIGFHYKHTQ